jgi:hypothetical protein
VAEKTRNAAEQLRRNAEHARQSAEDTRILGSSTLRTPEKSPASTAPPVASADEKKLSDDRGGTGEKAKGPK